MSSGSSRSSAQFTAARRLSSSALSRVRQTSSSRPSEAEPGFLRPVGEVLGVATTPPVGVAVLVEAFAGVLAQGLEHLVAGRALCDLFGDDHRLRHQLGERVEHIPGLDPVADHDRLRRLRVEAAGEHPEPVEHRSFPIVEQRIRPVDRRPQRLVAFHRRASPAREEPEPFVEQPADLQR